MVLPGYVVPGQIAVSANDPDYKKYAPACGLEATDRGLVATILGRLETEPVPEPPAGGAPGSGTASSTKWQLSVVNEFVNPYAQIPSAASGNSKRSTSRLPQVGDVVYARVLRLASQQVVLDIIAVENKGVTQPDNGVGVYASAVGSVHPAATMSDVSEIDEGYGAVIRFQDIRATERDKIRPNEQFAPGDMVRATVLSLGDEQFYYLTTIRNDLGVIFATDRRTGDQLVPLDWQTMVNPRTGRKYPRKCANPFVEGTAQA